MHLKNMSKKNIVISGINLFEGGPLSVIRDCLTFLNESNYLNQYNFIALVHKKKLFDKAEYANIKFIEFPKSRKSYLYRLYYEYFYFNKLSKKNNVCFWLSLHDITPRIHHKIPQAVYCHCPAPFNKIVLKNIYLNPTLFFFSLFYKYLYQINLKKNKFVIVQQLWIKNWFKETFELNEKQIIISQPEIQDVTSNYLNKIVTQEGGINNSEKIFFYPTFPRPFKNVEVICDAIQLVLHQKHQDFILIITFDGSENKYSEKIVKKFKHIDNIKFIGLIKREEVYEYYSKCDALIFPSKLETWGLPVSEFKQFNKPMLVANLPYAKETVGNYDLVRFFDPNNAVQLSELIINLIEDKLVLHKTQEIKYPKPFVNGWVALFDILLK
jgi:glycosyltransferase involved in cell wall biosynthesis